jgi:hypothetical protein
LSSRGYSCGFQVGVLHDDHVARGGGKTGAQRRALALVDLMINDAGYERLDLGAENVPGAVGRTVVDHDDLLVRHRRGADRVHNGADGFALVVAGDDDRKLHAEEAVTLAPAPG